MSVSAQLIPPSQGLVGWWRGEGNGDDSANGHNGTLFDGVGFDAGSFGQAFSFAGNPNRVYIPDSDDFKLTNSLSIAAWVYPKADCWHVLERAGNAGGSYTYSFGCDDAGHFIFIIHDLAGPQDTLSASITYNQWRQVTGTLDGATGDMRLYFDGNVVAQKFTSVRPSGDIPTSQSGIGIGNTPLFNGGFPFIGLVDEVLLYSRALSPAEVISLNGAPRVTVQPRGQVAYVGRDVNLSVTATGTAPLSYLWYKDGVAISWATNSTLTLTNVQITYGGDYSVVITNAFGSVTSSNALLVVNPVGVSLALYAGLTIEGAIGKSYGIQSATNVSDSSHWTTLTTLTLTQGVQLWIDTSASSATRPQRFYRIVVLP